jgi:hypothetical protein
MNWTWNRSITRRHNPYVYRKSQATYHKVSQGITGHHKVGITRSGCKPFTIWARTHTLFWSYICACKRSRINWHTQPQSIRVSPNIASHVPQGITRHHKVGITRSGCKPFTIWARTGHTLFWAYICACKQSSINWHTQPQSIRVSPNIASHVPQGITRHHKASQGQGAYVRRPHSGRTSRLFDSARFTSICAIRGTHNAAHKSILASFASR